MQENMILELSTLIETIPGPGPWTERHDEALILGLADVPDAAYQPLRREVLLRFKKRPSVPELRELAASLLPAKTYHLPRLEGEAAKNCVPEDVRRTFEGLRRRGRTEMPVADAATRGNWGIEHVHGDGRVERMPARHSREEAQRRADAVSAKHQHVTARIYQSFGTAGAADFGTAAVAAVLGVKIDG